MKWTPVAPTGLVLVSLLLACGGPEPSSDESGLPPASSALEGDAVDLLGPGGADNRINAVWTGDLDGMIERRQIRALVPYSRVTYFVDGGTQRGIAYEALRELEKTLNATLGRKGREVDIVFLPVSPDRIESALLEGRADIAAASIVVTPGRAERFGFSAPLVQGVREVIVSGPKGPKPRSLEDLSGETIYVRRSSSYYESLERLSSAMKSKGMKPVRIEPVDEHLADEDIVQLVAAGRWPMTVLFAGAAPLWSDIYPDLTVHDDIAIRVDAEVAWMFRPDSPLLEAELDAFVETHRQGTLFGNIMLKRYLKENRWVRNPLAEGEAARLAEMRALFIRYGEQYEIDWLMLGAQGYQESGLDQSKRSRSGAIGVMQLLASTAADPNVGIPHIDRLEDNIHAGAKYMRFILDHHLADAELDGVNKHLFAFAAYNAGPNRIARLRRKAADQDYDPNVWFDNVEVVVAENVGWEPVQYVRNIFKYYLAFRLVLEGQERRAKALESTG